MANKIPPATLRLLQALGTSPTGLLSVGDLRQAAAIKYRGFHPVLARMEQQGYVIRHYDSDSVELTFGGLRAIRSEPAA